MKTEPARVKLQRLLRKLDLDTAEGCFRVLGPVPDFSKLDLDWNRINDEFVKYPERRVIVS